MKGPRSARIHADSMRRRRAVLEPNIARQEIVAAAWAVTNTRNILSLKKKSGRCV